ncbi:MAG: hypothetical protein M3362_19920 [Acidobacteriota bacterium]|nr:hypothetical protein [Acidobacteriota bacterium]
MSAQTLEAAGDSQLRTIAATSQQNSTTLAPASSRVPVRLKATLAGHTKSIVEIVFSPNGETLATGSEDGSVRLWDARTGEEKGALRVADKLKWIGISWSPDGREIAFRVTRKDGDEKIQVCDLVTGKMKAAFGTDKDFGPVWSPDGRVLLTTTLDGFVKLWDAETGNLLATLEQDPPCHKKSFWRALVSDDTCWEEAFSRRVGITQRGFGTRRQVN